jgi:hypothetical protein
MFRKSQIATTRFSRNTPWLYIKIASFLRRPPSYLNFQIIFQKKN